VREAIEGLFRDVTFITLALAIAVGWSLFQVAAGFGDLVMALLTDYPSDAEITASQLYAPLTWDVGGRIVTLGPLVRGLVELGVVIVVAWLVRDHARRADRLDIAKPS